MNKKKLILSWVSCMISVLVLCSSSYAQPLSTKKKKAIALYKEADKHKVRGQYLRAIPLLQQAAKKDPKFIEAYFQLGLIYKYMRNFAQSTEMLQTALSLIRNGEKQKNLLFELGDNHLRQGNYQASLNYLNRYLENQLSRTPKIDLAQRWKKNAEYALNHKKEWPLNKPKLMSQVVNQFKMQYFPVLTADEQELIYTRRKSISPTADEDLVVSKKDVEGNWMPPVSISQNINSTLNEGTCTISADGRMLIFTSCTGRAGRGGCDLFFSSKVGNEWSRPINMGAEINSSAWESQPTLSADGRILYFTSDRGGGWGGKDIYMSSRGKDDRWLQAKNMGQSVNTRYNEISPFIHTNGRTLFFASNGRPGFGGYDIYKITQEENKWGDATNFGNLINDYEDQFSLFITADGKKAYYSYEKGMYKDAARLVEVMIPEELQLKYKSNIVKGIVRDKETNQPLYAHIELFDLNTNQLISRVKSDSINGQYLITVTQGADYALYTNATGYLFQSFNFNYESTSGNNKIAVRDIYLEKATTGAMALLNNISFKFDRYELNEKSQVELNKITTYMNENPHIKVEIGGHTDSRGTPAYNKQLSLKRAEIVAAYLIENGIAKDRLEKKGYGAEQPIRPNDTEENRQANRRIEFTITQL